MLFLWDLWQIAGLRDWNQKYFDQMQKIIDSIEYLDSILPFSNLKFLNPEFEFPKISSETKTFSAKQISHPLIHSSKRVLNPIENMKLGETLIITGSNMSGKTTYLRSIGINTLLALCGSATCSKNFELPLLQIKTSIKNEDSLEDGISFFYSEVRRIGSILNSSKTNEINLILLDELLKGTNTRERLIASKSILAELSKTNSFVFITTHDLDLAKKNSKTKLSYFQETVLDNKMNFDYKIKKGIIRSTNALKILELENLGLKFKQK
jgi:DNA mismatch repair ATPase MutS